MSSKRTTSESSQQQTQYTPTAEETELNKLYLARERQLDPQITGVQSQGLNLVSSLLRGEQLPGYLNTLPGGISPEVTQGIVNQSLNDLNVQLAHSGAGTFLESGAAQAAGVRTAGDIRNQSEQFNLQNLLQLLNIGIGGQAQVQAPIQGFSSMLSGRLAGLRGVNQTGTATSTFRYNPFKESFYSSLGSGLGSGSANMLFGGKRGA